MTPKNIELLLQVKKDILNDPYRFSMEDERFCLERKILIAAGLNPKEHDEYTKAISLLGITRKQGDILFLGNWPPELQRKYYWDESKRTDPHNARVVAAVIDWFIREYRKSDERRNSTKRAPGSICVGRTAMRRSA